MAFDFDLKNTKHSTHEEDIKGTTYTVTSVSSGARLAGSEEPYTPFTVRTHVDMNYADRFKLPIEEGKKRLESEQDGKKWGRGPRVSFANFAKRVVAGELAIGEPEAKAEDVEEPDNMDLDSCPSPDLELEDDDQAVDSGEYNLDD